MTRKNTVAKQVWLQQAWPQIKPIFAATLTLALALQLFVGAAPVSRAVDSGFASPSAVHAPNTWTDAGNAFSSDDVYATRNAQNGEQGYSSFNLAAIQAGSTIDGIEVQAEANASAASGCQLEVRLSWNNGVSATAVKTAALTGPSDSVLNFGGSADTWGRTWAVGEFTNANFVAKVAFTDITFNSCPNGTTVSLDQLQVKVSYTEPAGATPNPPLSQSCGLDIALVIDNSGSISSAELGQMKTAFHGFVDAFLPATPTEFSLTVFNNTASVTQAFTSDPATINAAIDAVPVSSGFTNWEDALIKAETTFDPRPSNPDLVLFASDGNPNRKGNPAQIVTESQAVEAAKLLANSIKDSDTRIVALGVGNDLDVENLKSISGPNVGTTVASDVITSDFSQLASDLAILASELCGRTITVTKLIDSDGDAQTTQDQTPAAGWQFDVAGSAQTTDQDGKTEAVEVAQGSHDVTETLQSGSSFITASCSSGNDPVGTLDQQGHKMTGINVGINDIVSCTFINTARTGGGSSGPFTLTVTTTGDGSGRVTSDDSEINCYSGEESEETCVQVYSSGAQVTLTAAADSGSTFSNSWSGACSGNNPVCSITMNSNMSADAHFSIPSSNGGGSSSSGSSRSGSTSSSDDGDVLGDSIQLPPSAPPTPQVLGVTTTLPRTGMPVTSLLLLLLGGLALWKLTEPKPEV